ncbi:MAG TPA: DUF502 domain-containing protein [Alphaproteobacteria bacterium]
MKTFSIAKLLRRWLVAGILITAPLVLTLSLGWWFINWVDQLVRDVVPNHYYGDPTWHISFPGFGLILVLVTLILIGALMAGFVGRWWMRLTEIAMLRLPVLRIVYSATKQVLSTVLSDDNQAFREVILVEFPRKDCWTVAFLTSREQGEISAKTVPGSVAVFVPTTPNLTSGYLIFVPENEIKRLDMSVEDALKMIISGGTMMPPTV